ncbi:MAG: dTDP-glucose 4,6-dehydratase [Candidatus Aminicenantia bacterium]
MAEFQRILITGGAGFIGSNLIHYLLREYPRIKIINLDKLTYAGNLDNLKDVENDSRYEFIKDDIRDKQLVEKIYQEIDVVVHLAAETHVDRSILEAGEFVLTDVYGTCVLLEALKKSNVKLFIHVSTDEVYGSITEGSFKETDPLMPSSPYAASKAGADRLAYSYFVTYHLPIIIVRPSNNFGPYQYPEKLIPLFVTNALENQPLPLYGDGTNIRDWLYVEDSCRAIDLIIHKGKLGEVYNISAGNEITNLELTKKILCILDKSESLIKFVPDRLGHDQRYSLNCDKLKTLGWKPKFDFDSALEKTVLWYKENEWWWRKIKEKNKNYKDFYEKYYKSKINQEN